MIWRAELSDAALRQLKRLPNTMEHRMARAIDELEEDPFRGDVLALRGAEWQGMFRKRVGRYRILFLPRYDTRVVAIVAILRRDERTYR